MALGGRPAAGFAADETFAQGSAATTANGVTRKVLSRTDGPAAGYETIIMDVTLDPGATVARHTHPGIESTYVMEGEIELPVQGRPTQMLKAGEAFQVPPDPPPCWRQTGVGQDKADCQLHRGKG